MISESAMRNKWPLELMSEIICHGEITPGWNQRLMDFKSDALPIKLTWQTNCSTRYKVDIWLLCFDCKQYLFLGDGSLEKSPEHEAQELIKKIRRQIRLLNRKWAELNQNCNQWQAILDEVSEVSFLLVFLLCFF